MTISHPETQTNHINQFDRIFSLLPGALGYRPKDSIALITFEMNSDQQSVELGPVANLQLTDVDNNKHLTKDELIDNFWQVVHQLTAADRDPIFTMNWLVVISDEDEHGPEFAAEIADHLNGYVIPIAGAWHITDIRSGNHYHYAAQNLNLDNPFADIVTEAMVDEISTLSGTLTQVETSEATLDLALAGSDIYESRADYFATITGNTDNTANTDTEHVDLEPYDLAPASDIPVEAIAKNFAAKMREAEKYLLSHDDFDQYDEDVLKLTRELAAHFISDDREAGFSTLRNRDVVAYCAIRNPQLALKVLPALARAYYPDALLWGHIVAVLAIAQLVEGQGQLAILSARAAFDRSNNSLAKLVYTSIASGMPDVGQSIKHSIAAGYEAMVNGISIDDTDDADED